MLVHVDIFKMSANEIERELKKALGYSSYEAKHLNEGIWCIGKTIVIYIKHTLYSHKSGWI